MKYSKYVEEILKIADEFLQIPSAICYEKPFLDYLNKKISNLGYQTILETNCLIVKPKLSKDKVIKSNFLLSAHIDRHGLIKNDLNQVEYLAFYKKKELNLSFKRDLFAEHEEILLEELQTTSKNFKVSSTESYLQFYDKQNGIDLKFEKDNSISFLKVIALRYMREDIISYNAISGKYLNNYKTNRYDINIKNNLITYDVDKELKDEDIVFMLKSYISKISNLFSGHIDNVISVAVLYYILKNHNFTEEIIFTTQEEIGRSYLNVINYMDTLDYKLDLIVLDTSPYSNFDNQELGFLTLRLGDENGNFDVKLVSQIDKYLEEQNIPIHYKSSNIGMTELGRVSFESKGRINGATIQLPTMNYHTTYETSTIESLESYFLILKFIGVDWD